MPSFLPLIIQRPINPTKSAHIIINILILSNCILHSNNANNRKYIQVSTSIPAFIPRRRLQLTSSTSTHPTGPSPSLAPAQVTGSLWAATKPTHKSSAPPARKTRLPTKHKSSSLKGLSKLVHKRDPHDNRALLSTIPEESQNTNDTPRDTKNPRLEEFHRTYLGLEPEAIVTNNKGEQAPTAPEATPTNSCTNADPISNFDLPTTTMMDIYSEIGPKLEWQYNLPSTLLRGEERRSHG